MEDRKIYVDGKSAELTETEYDLLVLMMKSGANNTVMVHIRNLRKKKEAPFSIKRKESLPLTAKFF